MNRILLTGLLLTAVACRTTTPTAPSPELPRVQQIAARADVQAAFAHIDASKDAVVAEWTALTAINAPSGHEAERAAYVESLVRTMKFDSVTRDAAGNVVAVRKGSGGGPTVTVDAHLDTVFQPGLKIEPRIEEGRIWAPGVGDNTRNVAAMLAAARALDAASIRTKGDLIFLFSVEEETSFKGIRQFLADHKGRVDHIIALDGGYSGFTYAGIGINWYRFHFLGPGGHTRSRTPPYSATLPAARAIARLYRLRVPNDSNLNIGMLGGAEVVNAKAADAWFTVDLRSIRNEFLDTYDRRIRAIAEEEARRVGMTFKPEVISTSRAAFIPGHREGTLVKTAEAVYSVLGFENPSITPTASNHASPSLLAAVSAISTGSTPCRDSHALTENCEIEPIYRGIKKIVLLAVALAGVSP
jgi:tripeptide aminopeptidase